FSVLTKAGLSYSTLTCTGLPAGDFRKVGGGVGLQKSEWKREVGSMVPFEAQMRVPEDVLVAARAENGELTDGDVLASEAIKTMRGSTLRIGAQTWYGAKISADGFAGLSTQVDAGNVVNAGGNAGADSSSVYLVNLAADPVNPEGVHYVLGNSGRMNFKDMWGEQQIETNPGTKLFSNVFTNNFLAYLGLVVPRPEAIYKIKNVVAGSPFTDLIGAETKSLLPLGLRGDLGSWRWFMNSTAHHLLHKSRITIAQNGAGASYVPEPVDVCGIKIQLTDSLVTTERAGLKP
ncbi:MAG: phage major capsid protein, partial [Chthoniobacteraceae bacterium]